MVKTLLILSCLVTFLFQGSAAADELSPILKGIQKKYGDLPGLTVTYTREVITRSMSMLGNQVQGDLASGVMYFKPPYRMRLQQETPKPETIVAAGETLWWYIPDQKRVYEYPSRQFGQELRLLSDIFHGLVSVEEGFKATFLGRNPQGDYEIRLTPVPPWEQVDYIDLTVTSEYDIRTVDIHNQLGSTTRFKLTRISVTRTFPEDFFKFAIPKGTEVIKEGGQ